MTTSSSRAIPHVTAGVRWVCWGRASEYGEIPGYVGGALLSVPAEVNAFNAFMDDWIKSLEVRFDEDPGPLPFWGIESIHWASTPRAEHLAVAHLGVEHLENPIYIALAVADLLELAEDQELMAPHALWQVILSTTDYAGEGMPVVLDMMLVDCEGMAERDMYCHVESREFLASLGLGPIMETETWMVEECRRLETEGTGFSTRETVVMLQPFDADGPEEVLEGLLDHDAISRALEDLSSHDEGG